METRRERLIRHRGKRSHEEIGAALSKLLGRKIGKGTVWKWEQVDEPNIDLEVFFALADFYDTDPRALATGKRSKDAPRISPDALSAAKGLERLHPDLKLHITSMVQTLVTMSSKSYHAWAKKERAKAEQREMIHDGE